MTMKTCWAVAAFACALSNASAAQVEVMYKLTCSPALDIFQLERFVADYSYGLERVNRAIEYANLSASTGIYPFTDGKRRTHRCAVGAGQDFELLVDGARLDLRDGGTDMLQGFSLDPIRGFEFVVLSSIAYAKSRTGNFVEICISDKSCAPYSLEVTDFQLAVE